MQLTAMADLPGDRELPITSPLSLQVSIYARGPFPGGMRASSLLDLQPDGRRVCYLQARAHRHPDAPDVGAGIHAHTIELGDARWLVTVSAPRCAPSDSPDATAELSSIAGAVDQVRRLAARLVVACLGGARGPASCDSDDPGFTSSNMTARGFDPLAVVETAPPMHLPGLGSLTVDDERMTPERASASSEPIPPMDPKLMRKPHRAGKAKPDGAVGMVLTPAGREAVAKLTALQAADLAAMPVEPLDMQPGLTAEDVADIAGDARPDGDIAEDVDPRDDA